MKAGLLLLALGTLWTAPLAASTRLSANGAPPVMNIISEHPPTILAGKLDWLDDFFRGSRKAEQLGRPAYQYTRAEDRRGNRKGFFHYLMTAIWRLAVAGASAGIAGHAAQKRFKETGVQSAFLIGPFVLALFSPLAGLVVAGVSWVALGGGGDKDETANTAKADEGSHESGEP